MKGKLLALGGAAVGYVFGSRAGRERYEQIKGKAADLWRNPRIQDKVSDAEHFVSEKAPDVQAKITDAAKTAVDAARSRFRGDTNDVEADEDDYGMIDTEVDEPRT